MLNIGADGVLKPFGKLVVLSDEPAHTGSRYTTIPIHALDVARELLVGPPAIESPRSNGRPELIRSHRRHNKVSYRQCQPEKSLPSGQAGSDRIDMSDKQPLLDWVEAQIRDRYGTMRELASRINRTQSALKRGLQEGRVGVDTVLLLARESGESPGRLLALAGKDDVDALIRKLYGEEKVTLPADVQAVVDFLMLEEPTLRSAQAGMVVHAKLLGTLQRSKAPTTGSSAGTPEARPDKQAKRGIRPK